MAKMTLIAEHLDEHIDKSKYRYRFKRGIPLEVSPSYALGSLGNPLFTIEFDRKDHHFLDNVDQNGKNALKQFGVNLGSMSKTLRIPSLSRKAIKPPLEKKEKLEKKHKSADGPRPKPLPPKLNKLTNSKLQILLKERNLSTEGKKAELIKRLVEEG